MGEEGEDGFDPMDSPVSARGRGRGSVLKTFSSVSLLAARSDLSYPRECSSRRIPNRVSSSSRLLFIWNCVHSSEFRTTVAISIVLSSIQLGVQSELPDFLPWLWLLFDHLLTAVFVLESCLKLFLYGCSYFAKTWHAIDFSIALTSAVDAWLLPLLLGGRQDSGRLGVVKVFRLLRLCRMLKVIQAVPELRMVSEGIINSCRSLLWVFSLFFLVLYTLAIISVEIVGSAEGVYPGHDRDEAVIMASQRHDEFNNFEYFGNLSRAMMSLFSISVVAEWEALRSVWEFQWFAVPIFFSVIFFISFGVVNVIVAVIVEHTSSAMRRVETQEKELMRSEQMGVITELAALMWGANLRQSDHDLSRDDLRAFATDPTLIAYFNTLDFPKGFTFDDMFTMFNLDGCGGLTRKEFEDGLHRLIYGTEFQRVCLDQLMLGKIKALHHDTKRSQTTLMATEFSALRAEISALHGRLDKVLSALSPATNVGAPPRVRPSRDAGVVQPHQSSSRPHDAEPNPACDGSDATNSELFGAISARTVSSMIRRESPTSDPASCSGDSLELGTARRPSAERPSVADASGADGRAPVDAYSTSAAVPAEAAAEQSCGRPGSLGTLMLLGKGPDRQPRDSKGQLLQVSL